MIKNLLRIPIMKMYVFIIYSLSWVKSTHNTGAPCKKINLHLEVAYAMLLKCIFKALNGLYSFYKKSQK